MIAETASGIFTNLVSAGVQRSGSLLFQKIRRLRRVDKAIKGIELKSDLYKQALDDFVIALGTYQGRYTEPLADFLDELARGSLLEAIAEAALLGTTPDSLTTSFRALYQRFLTDEPGADVLFQSLHRAFGASFEELARDRVVHHALTASHRQISGRLEKLEAAITAALENPSPPTFATMKPNLTKIAKGLQSSYRTLRIETNRGPRNVEINSIYIAPKLASATTRAERRQLESFIRQVERDERNSPAPRSTRSFNLLDMRGAEFTTFPYSDLQSGFKRIVVLGDPGGGKSTLCQKLCYDLAKNVALAFQYRNPTQIAVDEQRLPFRIVLRKFETARANDPQLDLLSYLCRDVVHYCSVPLNEIKESVTYLLETGRAVLAFDGLDEILETSHRQEFVELVSAFCDQYPLTPVMVTSRIVGYRDAALPDEFEELKLQKFDDDEIVQYVTKFMKVVGSLGKAASELEAQKFLRQTSDTASDLRRNPLMLGLMSWLFMASGDVPTNRPEIYRECSILMFEKWDQKRGIKADDNNDFDRSQLFTDLAAKIYGNPNLAGGVSREWLQQTLTERFQEIFENKIESHKSAKKFVEFITGRAWVMTEVGEGTYAFTHQTFLEYFFARYLDDHFDTVASLLRYLRGRIAKHEWNEVTHLALQIKTFRSLRKQEEAVQNLLSLIQGAKTIKSQTALMGFASRSFDYLSPSEKTVGSYLDTVFATALTRSDGNEFDALRAVLGISNSQAERSDFIRKKLASLLKAALLSGGEAVRKLAPIFVGFGSAVSHQEAVSGFLNSGVMEAVKAEVENEVRRRSSSEKDYAGLAWSLYGHRTPGAVGKFGVAWIYNFPPRCGISSIDGATILALQAGAPEQLPTTAPIYPAARDICADVADAAISGLQHTRPEFNTAHFGMEAPDYIWDEIYRGCYTDPKALVGMFVLRETIFQVLTWARRQRDQAPSRRRRRLIPKEALQVVLSSSLDDEMKNYVEGLVAGRVSILVAESDRANPSVPSAHSA